MRRIPLSVKNQSIETSGITKDYKEAICEYIWNGFEANAKNVELEWKHNQLDGGDLYLLQIMVMELISIILTIHLELF